MIRRLFLAMAAILMGMGILAFESRAQSIHAFYEDDDVVFRPELVGKWKVEGISVEFAAAAKNAYVIRLGLGSDTGICFLGHLIRLDGRYFLDAQITGLKLPSSMQTSDATGEAPNADAKSPQGSADAEIGSCSDKHSGDSWLLNQEHMLFRLVFTSNPDSFDVEFWNEWWVSKMAQDKKFNAPNTTIDDHETRIVFFGDRHEMRDLVIGLPAEAFEDPEHLERVSTPVAKRSDESKSVPGEDSDQGVWTESGGRRGDAIGRVEVIPSAVSQVP